ncbi:hypothetical protein ACLOJK_024939 [Asimina triloba]
MDPARILIWDTRAVVPTIYTDIRGRKIQSNQFSVTEHFRPAEGYPQPLPGVFFFYDFSPIKVDFTEENVSLLHFLTNICAIVGGVSISVFTVSGIVDAFIYHGQRAIKKKMEIGKYSWIMSKENLQFQPEEEGLEVIDEAMVKMPKKLLVIAGPLKTSIPRMSF